MNLYIISQEENNDYDTFDSAVVAAETPEEAAMIHPTGEWTTGPYGVWATSPKRVRVDLIGKAIKGTEAGVILTSFNAG